MADKENIKISDSRRVSVAEAYEGLKEFGRLLVPDKKASDLQQALDVIEALREERRLRRAALKAGGQAMDMYLLAIENTDKKLAEFDS